MKMNDFQQCVHACMCVCVTSSVMFPEFLELFSSPTPADVKQEVNFLESREISLHKTTVNLKTEEVKADLARLLNKLSTLGLVYICRCTSIIQQLKQRKSRITARFEKTFVFR